MPARTARRNAKLGDIDAMISQAASVAGVPEPLFRSLIKNGERSWKGWQTSPAGAQGPSQLMPSTAANLAHKYNIDPSTPMGNLIGGAYYLKEQLQRFKDPSLAVAAYNAGPGAVERHGGVPNFTETQRYVKNVMGGLSGAPAAADQGAAMPAGPSTGLPSIGGAPDILSALNAAAPSDATVSILRRLGGTAANVASDAQDPFPTAQGGSEAQAVNPAQQIPGATETLTPGVKPSGEPTTGGLNSEFARRFGALQQAVKQAGGDLTIFSGARDAHKQAGLYQDALRKYGTEGEARKHVAPPGKSNHDTHAGLKYGLGDGAVASDLRGDLALAHRLAPKFGLVFPMSYEPWHIEVAGIRGGK